MFIDHAFGTLPVPIEAEQLEGLVEKLRNQTITPEEIEVVVRQHLRIAAGLAKRYKMSSNGDELFTEAVYGMALALNRAPYVLYNNEVSAFIRTYMKRFVLETVRRRIHEPLVDKAVKQEEIIDPAKALDDLREQIYSSVKSDFERSIIQMRESGLKDAEIAELLSCERKKVSRSRQRVYERFLEEEKK